MRIEVQRQTGPQVEKEQTDRITKYHLNHPHQQNRIINRNTRDCMGECRRFRDP
jgi:hypothetical protein